MYVLYFELRMNPKRRQFVWETGGMDKKGFVPLFISENLDWRQRMTPKYKLLIQFEIADGSDDSNVLGHLDSMALEVTLNVNVQVTDSHLKEVGLRQLK